MSMFNQLIQSRPRLAAAVALMAPPAFLAATTALGLGIGALAAGEGPMAANGADMVSKHLASELVIGVTEGKISTGWSNSLIETRVSALADRAAGNELQEVRDMGRAQGVKGMWSDKALEGYLDAIDTPASIFANDIEAVAASKSGSRMFEHASAGYAAHGISASHEATLAMSQLMQIEVGAIGKLQEISMSGVAPGEKGQALIEAAYDAGVQNGPVLSVEALNQIDAGSIDARKSVALSIDPFSQVVAVAAERRGVATEAERQSVAVSGERHAISNEAQRQSVAVSGERHAISAEAERQPVAVSGERREISIETKRIPIEITKQRIEIKISDPFADAPQKSLDDDFSL